MATNEVQPSAELRQAVAKATTDSAGWMDRVGGRKFVGLALGAGLVIGARFAGVELRDEDLQTIFELYVAFVGGNAAEHGIKWLRLRESMGKAATGGENAGP